MIFFKRGRGGLKHRRDRAKRFQASIESEAKDSLFSSGRTISGDHLAISHKDELSSISARQELHSLGKKRRKIVTFLFGSLLIGASILFVLSQFISAAKVRTSSPLDQSRLDRYQKLINDYLSSSTSQRWRFLADQQKMSEELAQQAPEIRSVSGSSKVSLGVNDYEITFRRPIASWEIDSKKRYVDDEGVLFDKNYFDTPKLKVVDNNLGASSKTMEVRASNRLLSYIGVVVGGLKDAGYSVSEIEMPLLSANQFEAKIEGLDYPVKLTADRDAKSSVGDIVKAIGWFKSKSIIPEFIDARVQGRVFYK